MNEEPRKEHHWLQKLVGEWSVEMEPPEGSGEPPAKQEGTETVRSIGGLWTVGDGRGTMPGGGEMTSVMTLGYDPQRGKFRGTFIASMMTFLWVYEGSLDAAGRVLTLDTEGPSMDPASGGMAQYQDVIEFLSDDHRTLTGRIKMPDGNWVQFMRAHYRRKK